MIAFHDRLTQFPFSLRFSLLYSDERSCWRASCASHAASGRPSAETKEKAKEEDEQVGHAGHDHVRNGESVGEKNRVCLLNLTSTIVLK